MPRLYLFEEWATFGNCVKNVHGLHVCMLPVCRCVLCCYKYHAKSVLAILVIEMFTFICSSDYFIKMPVLPFVSGFYFKNFPESGIIVH